MWSCPDWILEEIDPAFLDEERDDRGERRVNSNAGMSLNEGGERPRLGDMLGSRGEGVE